MSASGSCRYSRSSIDGAQPIGSPHRSRARIKFIGSALAFLLSLSAAIAFVLLAAMLPMSWTAARTWVLLAALAGGLGAIVGAIIGWQLAPAAIDRRLAFRRLVFAATWRSVLAGAALIAGLSIVSPGDDLTRINDRIQLADVATDVLAPIAVRAGWAVTAFVFGIILFSIPAVLVIAPVVTVWIVALRRIVVALRRIVG